MEAGQCARTDSSIIDVVNRLYGNKDVSTPLVKEFVRNSVRRWKDKNEASINGRIKKAKAKRKRNMRSQNNVGEALPQNRQLALDVLALEWMEDNPATLDIKVYLIEKLMPCLIMGLEKLLTEVEKRDLVLSEERMPQFNPLNYLAQYLMRNNPTYSNFPEASPYARGLRKVAEDLRSNIFAIMDARQAKENMKAEILQKRLEREKQERIKGDEQTKRKVMFEDLFVQWARNEGMLPLAVVQNAIASFLEYVEFLHTDVARDALFSMQPPVIDKTGKLLNVSQFQQMLEECTEDLSNQVFERIYEHMEKCASNFQQAAERVTIRFTLKSLFLTCDHDGIGFLDRKSVLEILGNYYDSSRDHVQETLRYPREWTIEEIERFQDDTPADLEILENQAGQQVEEGAEREVVEADSEIKENGGEQMEGDQDGLVVDDETLATKEVSEDEESEEEGSIISRSQTSSSRQRNPNQINQTQFINICEYFLGHDPMRSALDSLVRFIKASYSETDEERVQRHTKARVEARVSKRKFMIEQLFDFWDVDKCGTLKFKEIREVLSNWKDISADPQFQQFVQEYEQDKQLSCSELHEFIEHISNTYFAHEDPFEAIVIFLHTSIERTFEEKKRGEARKKLLDTIDHAAKTSAGIMDPVYNAAFKALLTDAELHGKNKTINCSISLLEENRNLDKLRRGKTVLHYVAATNDDKPFVLDKYLYRDMKTVSFASVDSGKPIHISKVNNHPGVHFWNPIRKEGATGSLIVLPIKDFEKKVIGILSIDTLADTCHDKSNFLTQEISFYQGVTKALGQAAQFVNIRSKTVQVADSAMTWISRRCQNVHNSSFYLVEPGNHPADGSIVRTMFTTDKGGKREHHEDPPKMNRKENLFRDYLFKCIDGSETITSDAYGERHIAFPISDHNAETIAVADISIGELKSLNLHEMRDIQKMLRFLTIAHQEVAEEVSTHKKNIVLELEKENEDFRIQVMFDRLMLTDLRENVSNLDARAFAELKSYKDPPKLVHDILRTVLTIFYPEEREKFENWSSCKGFINNDLVRLITLFDPTAPSTSQVDWQALTQILEGITIGTVAKQSSLPAQHLFNWVFVCLSLIEHADKMNKTARASLGTAASTSDESGSNL